MEDSVVKSVDILLKDNLIRNLKKKLHQNQTKNKRSKPESMFALNCMGNCFHSRLSDTILKGDHPRTIPPKFGSNWPSGFRGVD